MFLRFSSLPCVLYNHLIIFELINPEKRNRATLTFKANKGLKHPTLSAKVTENLSLCLLD
jgi:hypothetical protein